MTTGEDTDIAPLVVEFMVDVEAELAFRVWTEKVSTWWPPSHTVGGESTVAIVFEAREGGRIFERQADGSEHQWGRVLEWSPPRRVVYSWHLFFDPAEATDVEVSFTPVEGGGTRVELRQSGWERLGAAAEARRTRTQSAWNELGDAYAAQVGYS